MADRRGIRASGAVRFSVVVVGAVLLTGSLLAGPLGEIAGASSADGLPVIGHVAPSHALASHALAPGSSGNLTNYLLSVSCAGPTECMAVGGSSSETVQQQSLAEAWNGSNWSIVPTPTLSGFETVLNGVSCVSPDDCVAVGTVSEQQPPGAESRTLIETWDGHAWSVVPSPSQNNGNNALTAVSCATPTSCLAVGGVGTTLTESWNGSAWSIVSSPNVGIYSALASVSCTAVNACMAVGNGVQDANSGTETLAESWNGVSWSLVTSPNPTGRESMLNGVSCTSPGSCMAVGADNFGDTVAETWDGSQWAIVPGPNVLGMDNDLTAVSCPGPGACAGVGWSDPRTTAPNSAYQTLAATWGGGAWSVLASPSPGMPSYLDGVSCTSLQACTAVGLYVNAAGNDQTLIEAWSGGAWSVVPSPNVSALVAPVVGMAAPPSGDGYWLTDSAGDVSAHGAARLYGSMSGQALNAPITHIVATPDGGGYWLVAADGGVFSFGDAPFLGSMGGRPLNAPVLDLAPTPSGRGYWLGAADGGVFSFGDARFWGSMGGRALNKAVVGMAPDASSGGYWLVAADGGIFAFGAPFYGSTGSIVLNRPVVAMAPSADSAGYWFAASDGGVFAYGDSAFSGSMGGRPLNAPVVGMAADPSSGGYWLVAADGGIFAFDAPFFGAS